MDKDVLMVLADAQKRHDELNKQAIKSLREEGLLELNNGAWNDTYDILDYNPACPNCGAKMMYNWGADLLQCPHCGNLIFGNDYNYRDAPEKSDIDFSTYYTEY